MARAVNNNIVGGAAAACVLANEVLVFYKETLTDIINSTSVSRKAVEAR